MGEAKRRAEILAGWKKTLSERFPPGTWVFGIGQHRGCSEVHGEVGGEFLQPFDYLNDYNPDHYRVATPAEVMEAMDRVMGVREQRQEETVQ